MRPGIQWKLATDNMVLHLRELLGSILLFLFALLVVALMFMMNELNSNLRMNLERGFRNGCERIAYTNLDNDQDRDRDEVLDFLLSQECVQAAGTWNGFYTQLSEGMQVLKEIQQDHTIMEPSSEGPEVIWMTNSAWELVNLELYKGSPPDQYNLTEYIPVYLGYEYRYRVEVGDILETSEGGTRIVAGIFRQGTVLPTEDLNTLREFTISSTYPMDYGIIEITTETPNGFLIFSIKEGYEFADVQEMILQAGMERDWIMQVGSLDARLNVIDEYQKPVKRYIWQMLMVVGLTACLVAACYQTMSIITRKSEYGILYANGASTRDLIAVILMENLVKLLISLILLLPLFVWLAQKVFTLFYGDRYMIQWMIWSQVSWKVLLVGLGMMLLSSILPVYTLTRYSPVELIGGNVT